MADFELNQQMFEQLMKQADEERLKKDAAMDQLKQAQIKGFIWSPTPIPSASQIALKQQPVDYSQQVQQAFTQPAQTELTKATDRYQDVLTKYKNLIDLAKDETQMSLRKQEVGLHKDELERKKDEDVRQSELNMLKLKMEQDKLALDKQKMDKEKQPNDTQSQAALYAKRLEQSEKIFQDLEKSGYDRTDLYEAAKAKLPEAMKSGLLKQQEQAERNFVNAILRKESGAAISPSEFENAEKQYFPRVGDTPEVREQKRQNRMLAIEGLKQSAGKAYNNLSLPEEKPTNPKANNKSILNKINPIKDLNAATSDKVKVEYQGQTLLIPRSRLKEAIKDGAKEVK